MNLNKAEICTFSIVTQSQHQLQQNVCRNRLVIPDGNKKNDAIQLAGQVCKNDVTLGQENSACMSPDKK